MLEPLRNSENADGITKISCQTVNIFLAYNLSSIEARKNR
jgi:hypothetical protein